MKPDDVRSGFLAFFRERDHVVYPSDRLIPENDSSLLFTPAGMNQFKDMFMGKKTLPFSRATTSQKCLRMPDLDNVGRTASHHTFFEMLGNFSFGDYFKKEAIAWAIEYLVGTLGIEFRDLAFSVYTDDDEAAAIWLDDMNVPPHRLYRFGEKSNFWPAEAPSKGPNGVCGPCSEIFVDLGGGCGRPECDPDCDCGRYVEVWNLVFTQFMRKDKGVLEALPQKNIDTGMGFERLVRVLEGAGNNFETSLFRPIVREIAARARKEYGADPRDDVRIRRIADHVRAVVFCVSEGIAPSNEKQGYVVRKLLRRAVLDGNNLGMEGLFVHRLVPAVVQAMGAAYPELQENQGRIEQEILREEDKFSATFVQGLARLEGMHHDLEKRGERVLPGASAFLLYDTFGFPLDITVRYMEEKGGRVDVDGFDAEMEKQRSRARAGSTIAAEIFDTGPLSQIKGRVAATHFVGYDTASARCRIMAILADEGLMESAPQGARVSLILDQTPFYAEAGGQVGDRGRIASDTFSFAVNANTAAVGDFVLHTGVVSEGTVARGDAALAEVDLRRRKAIQRNHTATHLLHFALRRVLGKHASQAGSLVEDTRLRFDFLHPKGMTRAEIEEVQRIVNEKIRADLPVAAAHLPLAEARQKGAMALFGEKYGEIVRSVEIAGGDPGETSLELCGGTHVCRTGEIGAFRILSEESVAAGVRRIEAATGEGLEQCVSQRLAALHEAAALLKAPLDEIPRAIQDLQQQCRELRKEIARHLDEKAGDFIASIMAAGRDLGGGMAMFAGRVDGLGQPELRNLIDKIRARHKAPMGIILVSQADERVAFVAAVDEPLLQLGVQPSNAICSGLGRATGGGGGGRPNMAQGQGRTTGDLDALLADALAAATEKVAR